MRLHSDVWPAVGAKLFECSIRNFTIFLHRLPDANGRPYLFCKFENVGAYYQADMDRAQVVGTVQDLL